MDSLRPPIEYLADLVPYDPKFMPANVYLSANESSLELPEPVAVAVAEALSVVELNRYPDPLANELRDVIAQAHHLKREQVMIGNGGDELLFNVALAWGGPGRTLLNLPPTFSVYAHNAALTGTTVASVPRKEDFTIDGEAVLDRVQEGDIDYLVVTSPNNPTGDTVDPAFLEELLNATDALIIVDEAYGEFGGTSCVPLLATHKNLVVLRTFSKAYRLAGVRLGYILANEEVITELIKVRQPYSVDALSQAIGRCVFEQREYFTDAIESTKREREALFQQLKTLTGIEVFQSEANYLLFRISHADAVWQKLYEHGILIRDFSRSPGLENCLRVTVGTEQENEAFLAALTTIIEKKD